MIGLRDKMFADDEPDDEQNDETDEKEALSDAEEQAVEYLLKLAGDIVAGRVDLYGIEIDNEIIQRSRGYHHTGRRTTTFTYEHNED